MIYLLPYASQNGVSLVGVMAVVLYAHSTLGNSSGHIPFASLKPSLDDFEQGSVHNLNLSVGLRVGGGREWFLIPNCEQNPLKELLLNCFLLSET